MTVRSVSRAIPVVRAAAVVATLLSPAAAWSQTTELTVSAQAQGGYSTNPFFVGTGDTGSAYVDLSIQPQLAQVDELGNVVISANYHRTEYFRRYDGTDSYGVDASGQRRLSPLLAVHVNAGYYSAILGQGGLTTPTVVDPTTPVVGPTLPDITVLGLRQRQESINAGVGTDWQLSPLDSTSLGVRMSRYDYGNNDPRLTSSRSISADASYTRTLSSRTSVGLSGSGTWTEFGRGGSSGDYYSAQATYHRQLSEHLRMDLAAGILFIQSTTAGGRINTTGFSGNASLCSDAKRQTYCVRAYSSAQPTGFGDISKSYGAGLSYSYRLNEDDFITANADYSRVETTSSLLQIPRSNYVNASLGYEHSFTRTLVGGAGAGYRRISGGFFDHEDDLNLRIYLRISLGDKK